MTFHHSVYPDVVEALKKWRTAAIRMFIYSSGSIEAQKLLFTHSTEGDLQSTFFSGNFDTTFGSKIESNSYITIFSAIKLQIQKEQEQKTKKEELLTENEVLFVTDNILEAEAAKQVGIQVALANRPGNKQLPSSHQFPVVSSFLELFDHFLFLD